jgi:putative CocE/NonD family hydrolase
VDARIPDPAPFRAAFTTWEHTISRPTGAHPELDGTDLGRSYREWLERADDVAWWAARSGRGAGAHDAPTLVIGGWYDLFAHGTFSLFEELASGAGRASLLVGPWDHSPLPLRSGSGDLDFGPGAAVDLPGTQLRWLDHVLRDGPSPLADAVRVFVTGSDAWLDLGAWPPAHQVATWHPSPDGRLVEVPPATVATCGFTTDAHDPTPTVGGRLFARPTTFRAGPLDQTHRQARSDVLTFDGPPAERETLFVGPVRATIVSGSSAPTADVVLTLSDVRPDGRVLPVADGVRRRHDLGPDPVAFEVDLGHVAHMLRPGHRLRLDIAGGSFPAIDRQPPTGTARRTVILGGPTPSRLLLPVATGSA